MTDAPQGYYAASAGALAGLPQLDGAVACDVCVIGGGFTGLSAALHLARAGAGVVLLEADTIGYAASGRNGGQIHPGHRKSQAELEAWLGDRHTRDLWRLSEEALDLIFTLGADGCDIKHGLVIAAHNASAARDLAEETDDLRARYGVSGIRMMDQSETASELGTTIYPAARLDMTGGHLHPLKFARRLATLAVQAGAQLHERSRAVRIQRTTQAIIRTADGAVTAKQVILATDAFSGAIAPELGPYIAHVESFLVATEPLNTKLNVLPDDAAVADTRHVLDYYRKSADNRLLFAGRESYWNVPKDIAAIVRPRMLRVFPQLAATRIDHAWSGTVGITRTRMPHFGRLAANMLFGHGYSGHGVALATLGGKALAEAAMGNSARFDTLASVPAAKFPGGPLLRKPMVTAALTMLKWRDGMG
ncbi:MAG TPA: FAD-binding oxidoreductase [Rhizomicrobium sp.]|nr:FAD-binding oxidoreductase [Rhizomicrobium sp.]